MTAWLIFSSRGASALANDRRGPERLEPSGLADLVTRYPIEFLPVAPTAATVGIVGVVVVRVDATGASAWSPGRARTIPLDGHHLGWLLSAAGGIRGMGPSPRPPAPDGLDFMIEAGFVEIQAVTADPPTASPPGPTRHTRDPVVVARGPGSIQVHGVHDGEQGVPLAIGMIFANAIGAAEGRLRAACDFRPLGRSSSAMLDEAATDGRPLVAFFSNYLWSLDQNLDAAARLKRSRPDAITVFGGPSVPKYEAETESFLRGHREVDVCIIGEGEDAAVELLTAIVDANVTLDVSSVRGIGGLALLDGDEMLRTGDRERIADLERLPSPYLTGLLAGHDGGAFDQWVLETNRGCPYACAFCDWGSATNSRVRTYPLERVLAEIAYGAERGWSSLFIADANFGMLPRDLEIAEFIVDQAHRHGTPRHVDATFAKKASDRVVEIVKLFCGAGLMSDGVLSLQSVDEGTLTTIRRDNIRTDRYERLADAFRSQQLPLTSDIMVGLPGSTVESFKRDLDYCLRTGVTARVLSTQLLPNSPMNDPEYRAAEQLVVNDRDEVVGSRSFGPADRVRMSRLADLYWVCEHFHLLDEVVRFLVWDHAIAASDVFDRIDQVAQDDPDRFPSLTFVARWFHDVQAAPGGWEAFYDDLGRLLQQDFGLAPSTDLLSVLRLQEALAPLPGRALPFSIDLDHDYPAYRADHADGQEVPRSEGRALLGYGPVTVLIDDPSGLSDSAFRLSGEPSVDAYGLPQWHFLEDPFLKGDEWGLRWRAAEVSPPRGA